jgi:twitching motility protein PilT
LTEVLPSLDELLQKLHSVGGSDLHLKVGSPPAYRIDGALHLSNLPKLRPENTSEILLDIIPERFRVEFENTGEIDFAYGRSNIGRFRVNAYRQRGSINLVLRAVAPVSESFDELGLPEQVARLANESHGLLVVAGPAGSGKTTTLGSILDRINSTRRANIITIEDPIEVLHPDKMSIVSQREVGVDTDSFASGMSRVLRADPDVVYIGELRDRETVEAALRAAETGTLILTTINAVDAIDTVTRIVEFFEPSQQPQMRSILGSSLRGVIAQRLVPRADGKGRIPAVEVLANTERAYQRIVDLDKTHTLLELMIEGEYYGMQAFDGSILKLYQVGAISFQDAMTYATNPSDFKLAAQRMGLAT